MGEIVNLREYRKRRKRDQKREEATANRAIHGQNKQDKQRQALEQEKADQTHAANRIERDTEEPA